MLVSGGIECLVGKVCCVVDLWCGQFFFLVGGDVDVVVFWYEYLKVVCLFYVFGQIVCGIVMVEVIIGMYGVVNG